ncbi:putative reverse transcriptase domain-containing protein [Tanacetum coccineum]
MWKGIHVGSRGGLLRPEHRDGFVSTTFIPLLGIKPSDLGFSYEIEIASGQLVEIDKVIKGCKLEIEGHVFSISLIPFGSGSFDMIIRMDWLSNHRAKIICHEKVVRIPLPDDKVLRVIEERPKEKMRHLRSAKTKEQKKEEIVVVRDYPEVFLDDLSGLSPNREIEFHIKLVPGAIPVVKSPYRLVPSKMEELFENFSKIAKSLTILTQKCNTFDWVEEQERTFKTLKDKLCNAPVLALPDGLEDFVVYCDAFWFRTRLCADAKSDYDCEIRYHPSKANIVADALSRKERVKPKRVRAMNMILQSSIKDRILAAQKEACDESVGLQKSLDEMIKRRNDGELYYMDRIWVPLKGDVRTLIMDETHKLKYFVHPGDDKMYYDHRDRYWQSGIKKDKAVYVSKCLIYLKVKAEHQRPSSLLQQPEILEWKWE